jgi:hypothetical protein
MFEGHFQATYVALNKDINISMCGHFLKKTILLQIVEMENNH